MNSWSEYLLVVLALHFAPGSSADEYEYDEDLGESGFFFLSLIILLLN